MLTPATYVVPPEGAQLYVVERPGIYAVSGADRAWSTGQPGAAYVVAITTTGIASSPESGVVVTADPFGAARYVYLRRGDRIYARGWQVSGAPAQTAVCIWLHRPDGV